MCHSSQQRQRSASPVTQLCPCDDTSHSDVTRTRRGPVSPVPALRTMFTAPTIGDQWLIGDQWSVNGDWESVTGGRRSVTGRLPSSGPDAELIMQLRLAVADRPAAVTVGCQCRPTSCGQRRNPQQRSIAAVLSCPQWSIAAHSDPQDSPQQSTTAS